MNKKRVSEAKRTIVTRAKKEERRILTMGWVIILWTLVLAMAANSKGFAKRKSFAKTLNLF